MTPTIKHCFSKLLHLTQLFLLREYPLKEIKSVDPVILSFFQEKLKLSPILPVTKKIQQTQSAPLTPVQNVKNLVRSTPIPPSPDPRPPEPRPKPPLPNPLPPQTQPEPLIPEPPPPLIQDSKSFALEPLNTEISSRDNRELWKVYQTLFSESPLCETIPSDAIAQKNKNAWLSNQVIPPVIILAFHDDEKQLTFLKNIALAISLHLAPTRVLSASKLEKENGWESVLCSPHLRLVIACDYGLYLQPKLMNYYREVPQESKHFLNQIPLMLLSDLSLYLKEPQLKPLLWRAICNEFASS